MMRSRTSSSQSISELIRENPFLCAAFLALIALAALESDVGSPGFMSLMWTVLGFGFYIVSSLPERLMPGISGWIHLAMIGALGLIPYLIADMVWRRLRNR